MKNLYLVIASLFLTISISAQETTINYSKHFITFRTGYSIPVAMSQIGSPKAEVGKTYLNFETNAAGDIVEYSEKNSFGSRGAGLNFSLGYGYMINENFSFEFDFNYLHTLGFEDSYRNENINGKIYHATQRSTTSMFRVTPMFGVYANESMLIRPYAKFGLIVPLAGGTMVKLAINDQTGEAFNQLMPVIDPATHQQVIDLENSLGGIDIIIPTQTDIRALTSGSFSLGFMARLGAEYKFKKVANGRLKIFAEMEMQMLTIKAHKTEIKEFYSTVSDDATKGFAASRGIKTEFTQADIPEILKNADYLKEIVETSNSTYDVNNPHYDRNKALENLTFRDNYNAFAFMIGLKFGF